MFKIYLYKEKYNMLNNVAYLLLLVIFTAMVITNEPSNNPVFALFWFTFMTETLKYSVFDLAPHLSKGVDYKTFKVNATHLSINLKLLSIEPLLFIKYNFVYTMLRLLPFWIVIIVFNGTDMVLILSVFTLAYVYKSIIGPLHSFVSSHLREITINHKELGFKQKTKLFYDTVKTVNPFYKNPTFRVFYSCFVFGSMGILFWFYTYVFLDTFNHPLLSPFHPLWISILITGFILLTLYGSYLIKKERRLSHEIYQS